MLKIIIDSYFFVTLCDFVAVDLSNIQIMLLLLTWWLHLHDLGHALRIYTHTVSRQCN